MNRLINISFDNVIFKLLCLYAFFIPLEKILEVFFGIDTVFKPYRVVAILVIIVFIIKSLYKWEENKELKSDMFLYLIFIYGGIITTYRMITTNFQLGFFYNDTFQIVLYLGVFVVIKHCNFSMKRVLIIIQSLASGIVINALYIFYNLIILKNFSHRNSGFMDNPNYLALSLVVLVLFMLTHRTQVSMFYKKILWLMLLFLIGYIFIIAGSRSGLSVLAISSIVMFYFSSIKEKLVITIIGIGMFFFVGFLNGLNFQSTGSLVLLNRINKDTQNDPRFPAWRGAIRSAEVTNFMGTGVGQFKARFREFYYQENNELIRRMLLRGYFLSAHSDYFALLAIYGVIGLLAYLTFLFLTVKLLFVKIYESIDTRAKNYYQYGFLAILVLILFGITAENFNSALYWIVLSTSTKVNFT